MSGITIFRQIMIKELVTENSKSKKIKQINDEINSVLKELKEFNDQKTKALTEASLRGADQNQMDRFRQQFESEAARYHLHHDELLKKIVGVEQLAVGEEIAIGSVEGPFELKAGQTLQEATAAEIVIKDGTIIEIRR